MKKTKNWHLSLLVLLTSIFSILVIHQVVLAQAGRITGNEFCFNPDACVSDWGSVGGYWEESQDSSGNFNGIKYHNYPIYGIGIGGRAYTGYKLSISDAYYDGVLRLDSGSNDPGLIWSYNDGLHIKADNELNIEALKGSLRLGAPGYMSSTESWEYNVYTDNRFGIGTEWLDQNDGNHLHIFNDVANKNAEIKIQSNGSPDDSPGSHWSIYHDYQPNNNQLRFWQGDDLFAFKKAGSNNDAFFGIGTDDPMMNLHIITSDKSTRAGILLETDTDNNLNSWRIHNDYVNGIDSVNNLSFGHYANRDFLTLTKHGRVGIGTSTPMADLSIHEDIGNSYLDISAKDGEFGDGDANLRLINNDTGWGIRSLADDGNLYFSTLLDGYGGDNNVDYNVMTLSSEGVDIDGYLKIDHVDQFNQAPPASDCTFDTIGRMILKSASLFSEQKIYVCSYLNAGVHWYSVDLSL